MVEERPYTNAQLKQIVENEGLGYAVQYYLNPAKIEDPYIRKLWGDAGRILNLLTEFFDSIDDEFDLK